MPIGQYVPRIPTSIGDEKHLHLKEVEGRKTAVYQLELLDQDGEVIEFRGASGDILIHLSSAGISAIRILFDELDALAEELIP